MTSPQSGTARRVRGLAWWWGPVLLYAVAMFAVSAVSRPPAIASVRGFDKLLHLVQYAGFGALFCRAVHRGGAGRTGGRLLLTAWALGTLYGATDELHQHFVPNRVADPWDLLADSVGSLCGAALYYAGVAGTRRS